MKIAIYDKWLSTFGGGEKVACVMAETLSKKIRKASVFLISNSDVNKSAIEKKMGVNLSRVKMVTWYERSYDKLSPLTKEYDIFINVSYFDHLPSKAKTSYYYVHFPTPIKSTFFGFIKYEKFLPFLRKYLVIPEIISGIDYLDEIIVRSGKWLSGVNTLVVSNAPKNFTCKLRIFAEQLTIDSLNSVYFLSPNANVILADKYIDHKNNVLTYSLEIFNKKDENFILKINTTIDPLVNPMGLVSITIKNFRFFLWNIVKRYLPKYEMALYGSHTFKPAEGLDTYKLFLANSIFTKKWTKRYWNKDSMVLYPPVDVHSFHGSIKKNYVLNVGRFFVGGHSKRQDVLVQAFKRMIDLKIVDKSWELHLVGGVAIGFEHEKYLRELQEEAKNYPIYFHINAEYSELKKLYSISKIYWHATGYGENSNNEPIRFEHFGIAPVEAMAAGCVPLVFDGGGVVESVGENSGLLWNSIDTLIKTTKELLNNKSLLNITSKNMEERAIIFSTDQFSKKLISLLKL